MPIDYSKWDNIELSDDEDFECHPNVDKKSMVRWKQAQIHKERQERHDQHDLLLLEHSTSQKFISSFPERLATLLAVDSKDAVWTIGEDLKQSLDAEFTEPMRKESLSRIEKWPGNWEPPQWGDVLKDHRPWNEEVFKVFDDIKKQDENDKLTLEQIKTKVTEGVATYIEQLKIRQARIMKHVTALEKEMSKKLTVDQLKTGFDKTSVAAKVDMSAAPAADHSDNSSATKSSSKQQVIEVIHDPAPPKELLDELDGIPIEVVEDVIFTQFQSKDEDLLKIHPKLIDFSRLTEFSTLYKALKADPGLLTEEAENALMLRALSLEILTRSKSAKTCVFNSQILKFVRELGPPGIDIFFEKLSKAGSTAHNMFYSEVKKMEEHIVKRGSILRKERIAEYKQTLEAAKAHQENMQKMYQTYLQEDGSLKMPIGEDADEVKKEQKKWFDALPEYFQEGLLLEDVEKINQYLGSLEPEQAEKEAEFAIQAGFIQMQEAEDEDEQE